MQRACDRQRDARGSAQNQHGPVVRIACHRICGAGARLRFLLLVGFDQRHRSFPGSFFIANAFDLPSLVRPNGPD